MALISRKKKIYPYSQPLGAYLKAYGRHKDLPVRYDHLSRAVNRVSLYDREGKDTLWSTLLYSPQDTQELHEGLRQVYAILKAEGDEALMRHLYIERIDVCDYGNTTPYRVKIVNRFNENFDYFYIKQADANRILGLELEYLLSPDRINFVVSQQTLVEEHIPGIPGEIFIKEHLKADYLDEIRVAKEFIKFNERCWVRLLGDMHKNNFVVDVTPDFEETIYRIRPIDFDQQCYEGNYKVYLPQYHKENNPIIMLGMGRMTAETTEQYQREERAAIRYRMFNQKQQIRDLLEAVREDEIAPAEHVRELAQALAEHYEDAIFLKASTMGRLVELSLARVSLKRKKHQPA